MHDGSITFSTALDNAQLEKDLAGLTKKIEKKERDIAALTTKRDKAKEKGLFDVRVLDKEQAKLQEIKDRLAEIRAVSKDKSYGPGTRAEAKAQIPAVQDELREQQERVRALQSEWNKTENAVDRYSAQLDEAEAALRRQKEEAGYLQQQLDTARPEHINEAAEKIRELKFELKDLEGQGKWFGDEDYDRAYGELARVAGVIKEHKREVTQDAARLVELADGAEVADQRIAELSRELAELKARQKELGQAGIGLGYQEYDNNAARMAEITRELKEYQKALYDAGTAAEAQADRAAQMREKMNSVSGSMFSAFGTFKQFKAAADQAFAKILNDAREFLGVLGKAGTALKKFSKAAVEAFSRAAMGVLELLDKVNVFPRMFSSTGKSLKRLGQMIRRVFVFSVITAGLRVVRAQMSEYLTVNAEFSNALGQLKGVLLTAFQPIYDVAVPALTALMNLLARAIAAVTQFTAVLFGTTAKQAQKNAQALYKQAKATKAAGGAAEEASNQLASFDEINKLQDESSASGGGADADAGALFDWEYEDTPFPDWGEAFSAFLDRMLAGVPKLKEAFKGFADWLNNLNRKLYDMFTFPGVLDKVKRLGRELADALNELVDAIDWELWGRALGAGLNLALNFLTSFLYEFDWVNLGRRLAELVNGLAAEIDWYEFGRLLWSGFKIGLETLAGFIVGLDMAQLAKAASDIILGFFDEMVNTIKRIPWYQIGQKIAEFLNNIKWYEIITAAANAIKAALEGLIKLITGFINRLEWSRIADEIARAINDAIGNEALFAKLAKTLSNLFLHIFDFIREIISKIEWEQIGRDIAAFLAGLDWAGMFSSVYEAFNAALDALSGFIIGFLDEVGERLDMHGITDPLIELVQTVHDFIQTIVEDTVNWAASLDLEPLAAAFQRLLEAISPLVSAISDGLLWAYENVLLPLASWIIEEAAPVSVDALAGAFEALNAILGPVMEAIKLLWEIFQPVIEWVQLEAIAVMEALGDVFESVGDIFSEHGEQMEKSLAEISDAIQEMWAIAEPVFTLLKELVGAVFSFIGDIVSEKIEGVIETMDGLLKFVSGVFSGDWGKAWEGIKEAASAPIKEVIGWIESLLKLIGDAASAISDFLGGALSSAKNAISGAISNISNGMSGKSGGIGGSSRMYVQSMPDISVHQIPALANGAVIPPNREFMAVLGDQRSGNNLEAPEGLIRKIVREEAGGNNTALLEAILEAIKAGQVIMVDRKVLGRVARDEINRATRASGKNAILT